MALIALLLVVPVIELFVFWQVAQIVGIGEAILLLLAISLLGAWLVKRQGLAIWRQFNATLAQGQIPHREIVDGALLLFAGALLLVPGFVTAAIGALLLLPPVRAGVRTLVMGRFRAGRVVLFGAGRYNQFRAGGTRGGSDVEVWDVESWEEDPGARRPQGPGELER